MSLAIEPPEQSHALIRQGRLQPLLTVSNSGFARPQRKLPHGAIGFVRRFAPDQKLFSVPRRREPALCGYLQTPRRIS